MAWTTLLGAYASEESARSFSSTLPPLPKDNVQDKTAYLSALRSSTSRLQGEINAFLTQKMEEDKAAEAAHGSSQKPKVEEDKDEEMYGEEDPENDG